MRIESNGTGGERIQALHLDHLGSVRQVTDWNGVQLSRHRYYPFGEEATPVSDTDPAHKFTGHERDEGFVSDLPLDYMHARYCSPVLGRFWSVDPIDSAHPGSPQSWNRYPYVRGNPLKFKDPDGRAVETVVDLGFVALDLAEIANSVRKGEGVSRAQALTLAGDVLGAAIPFLPGLGRGGKILFGADKGSSLGGDAFRLVDKQFGKKAGQHMVDFGLDASKATDRAKFRGIIDNIVGSADEVVQGTFRGQGDVTFFVKGKDVVVSKDGNFVTILENGVENGSVKKALKKKQDEALTEGD